MLVCGRLVIRILPPDESKSLRPLGMKFGSDPSDSGRLLRIAKELDLNVIGVRLSLVICSPPFPHLPPTRVILVIYLPQHVKTNLKEMTNYLDC